MDLLEKGLAASNFAMLGLGDIVIPGEYDYFQVNIVCAQYYSVIYASILSLVHISFSFNVFRCGNA